MLFALMANANSQSLNKKQDKRKSLCHLSLCTISDQERDMTLLDESQAKIAWNDFTSRFRGKVPFSYNPSLYYFYKEYFGWKPYYILLQHEGNTQAILPLVHTGKAWVSLPHFSYGGMLSVRSFQGKTSTILKIVDLLENKQLSPGFYQFDISDEDKEDEFSKRRLLIIRGIAPMTSVQPASEKTVSYMEISGSKDELWKQLSPNLRRKIRKAEVLGLDVSTGGYELVDDFYKVYSKRMHQLGSPAYAKRFFKVLMKSVDEAKFFVVHYEGKAVGAAFVLAYQGFYESAWFATDRNFWKFYVADFLNGSILTYVAEQKGKVYSLGRSTEKGTVFQYKNHWPVKNDALFVYSTVERPSIRKYTGLSELWKIIPGVVARSLGPVFVRHIY
ncbi:MAG: GNAT family N-acetyltransferase [Bacteroidales bacterium]|nr:GNAT family N-acetyltransferase [Bacteroidales bacterium]